MSKYFEINVPRRTEGGFLALIKCSRSVLARRGRVFEYMVNPKNLPLLLSKDIQVEVDNADAGLAKDSVFSFVMTRYSLSQPVKLCIEEVHRDSLLTYRQVQGLFEKWIHTMKFEDQGEDKTLVTDIVNYQIPLGVFGHLADDIWIRKDMKRILNNRLQYVANYFAE